MKKFLSAVIENTQPIIPKTAVHLLYMPVISWLLYSLNFSVPRFIIFWIQLFRDYEFVTRYQSVLFKETGKDLSLCLYCAVKSLTGNPTPLGLA